MIFFTEIPLIIIIWIKVYCHWKIFFFSEFLAMYRPYLREGGTVRTVHAHSALCLMKRTRLYPCSHASNVIANVSGPTSSL